MVTAEHCVGPCYPQGLVWLHGLPILKPVLTAAEHTAHTCTAVLSWRGSEQYTPPTPQAWTFCEVTGGSLTFSWVALLRLLELSPCAGSTLWCVLCMVLQSDLSKIELQLLTVIISSIKWIFWLSLFPCPTLFTPSPCVLGQHSQILFFSSKIHDLVED